MLIKIETIILRRGSAIIRFISHYVFLLNATDNIDKVDIDNNTCGDTREKLFVQATRCVCEPTYLNTV